MREVKDLKRDADILRAVAHDIEIGKVQSFVIAVECKDEIKTCTPYGLLETERLVNRLNASVTLKVVRENIDKLIELV